MELFVVACAATISAWGFGWCHEREGFRGAWPYFVGAIASLLSLLAMVLIGGEA